MAVFIEDLYKEIIQTEALSNTNLRIISGYSSGSFLEKVCKEFPHLNIHLYIGMASQGISKSDHEVYCNLTKNNPFVNVYYQTRQIPTHMKIVNFSSIERHATYIGSANFSESGFVKQREVMVRTDYSMANVFQYQYAISTICIEEGIDDMIPIFPDEFFKSTEKEDAFEKIQEKGQTAYIVDKGTTTKNDKRNYIKKIHSIRGNADPNYYKRFTIEIVQDSHKNPRWKDTGINAWVNNKIPTLSQKAGIYFDKVFPKNEKIKIYTDDDKTFHGILTGRFNSELKLLDGNFYEYIKNRIDLEEFRPISYQDTLSYGVTDLSFERINKNEYIMSFRMDK